MDEIKKFLMISKTFEFKESNNYFIGYYSLEQEKIFEKDENEPSIEMIFCLKGKLTIVDNHKKSFLLLANEYNFFHTHQKYIRIECETESVFYIVSFQKNFLNTLLSETENNFRNFLKNTYKSLLTLSNCNFQISHQVKTEIEKIPLCRYDFFYKKQWIDIKVKEIFYLCLHQFLNKECAVECSLKDYQIPKIKHAKQIIENKISESCSLLKIAKEVGLNDCTLKKGFKEIYGTTLFGYLADIRMQDAQRLLLENKWTINEIAEKVGYRNSTNFIQAFKKKFACSPKQYILENAPFASMEN